MNINIDESYSNNSKIKEIDKLLSKIPNDLDPKMISQSKMYGYTSHINKRFNVNIINKVLAFMWRKLALKFVSCEVKALITCNDIPQGEGISSFRRY